METNHKHQRLTVLWMNGGIMAYIFIEADGTGPVSRDFSKIIWTNQI